MVNTQTRRQFLKGLGFTAAAASFTGRANIITKSPSKRPNIVFIMSDDHCLPSYKVGQFGFLSRTG